MSFRRLTSLAVLGSLALHAALVPPLARRLNASGEAGSGEAASYELLIPLADLLTVESGPAASQEEPAQEEETPQDPAAYARTTANQESLTAPEAPDFISDRNTLASSPNSPSPDGDPARPNLDGVEWNTVEVDSREFRDGPSLEESPTPEQPNIPQPSAVPSPPSSLPPPPSEEPLGEPLPPDEDAIALPPPSRVLDDAPSPEDAEETEAPPQEEEISPQEFAPPRVAAAPVESAPSTVPVDEPKAEAFQPQTRREKMRGAAQNFGDPALDTKDTALGRYQKQIVDNIYRVWRQKIVYNSDFMSYSEIRVRFTVDRYGNTRIVEVPVKNANPVIVNLTLSAIEEADIPEMPDEVRELLGGEDFSISHGFKIIQ